MFLYRITLFLCLLFSHVVSALADEPVSIYSYYLKERLSYKGGLGYNKVLDDILQDLKEDTLVKVLPLRRGSVAFERDLQSCTFPANEKAWRAHSEKRKQVALISSLAMDMVSIRVYTRLEQPEITKREDLSGKNVGHLIGSAGKAMLNDIDGIRFFGVEDETLLLNMLAKKRLDAVLGFHPDMLIALDRLGHNEAHFSKDFAIFDVPVYVLCHKTERNQRLIEIMNKRIEQIRNNGRLQEYLGRHAILAPQ